MTERARRRRQGRTARGQAFVFERMEPRILLSADLPGLDALLAPARPDDPLPDPLAVQASDPLPTGFDDAPTSLDVPNDPPPRQLLIVDGAVDDLETLVQDIQAANEGRISEVFVLDPARDGIEQVAEILSGQQDLAAVHIVSHGADGALTLGSGRLDGASLDGYAEALGRWGQGLGADGDLLLYGCDLAASTEGRQLVDAIAELTGADVAASDDPTGSAASGGDWQLEYRAGTVEVRTDALAELARWDGTLGSITVSYVNDQLSADADTSSLAALAANPGADGLVSLREAIIAANNDPGQDTITLAAGNYQIEIAGANEDAAASGDLDVTDDLVLRGAGSGATSVDGRGLDRVFHLLGGTLDISDLAILNGDAGVKWGGAVMVESGTGLTLDGVLLQNNQAKWGGALQVEGSLTASNFVMDGNTATADGGAINVEGNGVTATLSQGTLSNNNAGGSGGGIYVFNGTADLSNVTLSGNRAGADGGGLYNTGTSNLVHVTVADNDAGGSGGGLFNAIGANVVNLQASLVANNTAGTDADVSGDITSDGGNLVRDPGSATGLGTDLTGVDPLLGALADNGGPSPTHALLGGSPAIDALAASIQPQDQRGAPRSLDGDEDGTARPDIGAYEYQPRAFAEESFDYVVGALEGNSGGSGWATGWTLSSGTTANVVTPGLADASTTLVVAGGSAQMDAGGISFTQSRELDGAYVQGADGTSLWLSFLLKPDQGGLDGLSLELGNGAGGSDKVELGYLGNDFILTRNQNILFGAKYVSNQATSQQTFLMVARVDFQAGNDTVSLYIDPTPGSALPDVAVAAQLTSADLGTFTTISIVGGSSSNKAEIDEIRLGNSYAAVTPVAVGGPSPNSLPQAVDDTATTAEDTAVTIDVLANDSDPDGDTLSVISASAPNGSVTINADNTLSYTPNADFNGSDTISYTIDDGQGGQATASVTVTVTPVNDAPQAVDDTATTAEDTAVTIDVLANDSDPDGDTLSVISANALNGSVTVNADNTLSYTPNADFNGSDTISYTIDDGKGGQATASVTVTVAPVNDEQVLAVNTGASVAEGGSLVLDNTLLQATDVDNTPAELVYTLSGVPTNGTLYRNGSALAANDTFTQDDIDSGRISYSHDGSETTADSFDFSVDDGQGSVSSGSFVISVVPVDDPTVTAPDSAGGAEDTVVGGNVLANDSDLDDVLSVANFSVAGDATVYSAGSTATLPGIGSLTIGSDGSFSFTPVANWNGTVPQVSYTTNTGATDTLDITVTPVDDPTVTAPDSAGGAEDTVVGGNVLANDSDVDDVLSVASFSVAGDATVYSAGSTATLPGIGSLTIGSDGNFGFTPAADWNGSVPQVSYTTNTGASDTLDITITPVNDPPFSGPVTLAAISEDSGARLITQAELLSQAGDVENDSLTATGLAIATGSGTLVDNGDGTWSYTPAANDDGSVVFTYSIGDGVASTPATATLDILPVNDAPSADDETVRVLRGGSATQADLLAGVSLLDGDSDPDAGDSLRVDVVPVTAPLHGNLTLNPDGTFVYVHDGSEGTSDSFEYRVLDASGASAVGQVRIEIGDPVVTAPLAPPPETGGSQEPEQPDAEEAEAAAPPAAPSVPPLPAIRPAVAELVAETAEETVAGDSVPVPVWGSAAADDSGGEGFRVLPIHSPHSDRPSSVQTPWEHLVQKPLAAEIRLLLADGQYGHALDQMREAIEAPSQQYQAMIGAGSAATAALSVGYVAWLLRGGVLLSTMLSSLPAWQFIDPLPVLARTSRSDEGDDESLEGIIQEGQAARESREASDEQGR